jgi:hypothetical protein
MREATCGHCGRSFPDIYPSGRCPFEYDHDYTEPKPVMPSVTDLSLNYKAVAFFYEHAAFSYDPATETADEGKMNCAMSYALAEAFGKKHNVVFDWDIDYDAMNWEFNSEYKEYTHYMCEMKVWDEALEQYVYADGLGGIMFADKETNAPEEQDYARVIQAELIHQYYS